MWNNLCAEQMKYRHTFLGKAFLVAPLLTLLLLSLIHIFAPFGVGVLIGIGVIAKLIEFIFSKAEIHAYYGIIGLIVASPIAILMKTNWSGVSVFTIGAGVITFGLGWLIANKLGGE